MLDHQTHSFATSEMAPGGAVPSLPAPRADSAGLFAAPRPVEASAETVAGGVGYGFFGAKDYALLLSQRSGRAAIRYGWDAVRRMMDDPAVGSSIDVLKFAVLADEAQVLPRHRVPAGRPSDSPGRDAESVRAADLCRRNLARLQIPMGRVLWEMMDAVPYGCHLSELVIEVPEGGPLANTLALKAIKPKAHLSWSFAVDAFMNILGILPSGGAGIDPGGLIAREKFAILTWGGVGGDPRGKSALDRVADCWAFRAQLPAEQFTFLQRFASPVPVLQVDSTRPVLSRDASGNPIPGAPPVSRAALARDAADQYRSGHSLILDVNDKFSLSEPKADGQAFGLAMDLYRREIVLGILLQIRATMEAQYGSKADSESSADVLGNAVRALRRWLGRAIESQVFWRLLSYNEDADYADEFCPEYSLGSTEHQDVSAMLNSLAPNGYYLHRSQFEGVDSRIGMPARAPGWEKDPTPKRDQAPTNNGQTSASAAADPAPADTQAAA